MPCLALYLDDADFELFLPILNADEEIAFIVADGPGRWIAKKTVEALPDGPYVLWHAVGGPLTQRLEQTRESPAVFEAVFRGETTWTEVFPRELIADPWGGWTERKPGGEPRKPLLGDPPNIFHLSVCRSAREGKGMGLSALGWIGNHYRLIGSAADPKTEQWWKRMRATIKRIATPIQRFPGHDKARAWAFPSAMERIAKGCPRDGNPWC